MPTRLPRHTVTESGDVAAALRHARDLLPHETDGQRLRRLVVLGSEALAAQAAREERERRRRAQLALLGSGEPADEQAIVLTDALDDANAQ